MGDLIIKLLQASFLMLSLAIPLIVARRGSAVLGLRRTVLFMAAAAGGYAVLIAFVIPRFV